jgi:hypothetical protein
MAEKRIFRFPSDCHMHVKLIVESCGFTSNLSLIRILVLQQLVLHKANVKSWINMKDRFQEQQDVVRGGLLLIPVVFLKLIRNAPAGQTDVARQKWSKNVYESDLPSSGSHLADELSCWLDTWEQREKEGKVIPSDAQSTVGIADQWGGFLTFPNVCTLLLMLCVFPVTTCTCERCVSALRRVKTFLRTSCGQRAAQWTHDAEHVPRREDRYQQHHRSLCPVRMRRVDFMRPDVGKIPNFY